MRQKNDGNDCQRNQYIIMEKVWLAVKIYRRYSIYLDESDVFLFNSILVKKNENISYDGVILIWIRPVRG